MSLYEWSERFSVGVPSIDEQHKRILELANSMHLAHLRDDTADTALLIVLELSNYIEVHFAHEEDCMQLAGYSGFEPHVEIHREMSARVNRMVGELQDGLVRVSEVREFLAEWITTHILEEDMAYASDMEALAGPGPEEGGHPREDSLDAPDEDEVGLYQWNDRFATGISSIDGQHKRIFDLAHEMHVALLQGDGGSAAGTIIRELSAYVQQHFADEEQRMREAHYPGLESHMRIHRKMAAHVDDLLDELRTGKVSALDVHRFVVTWLRKHICDTDMDYVPFLRWEGDQGARRQCQ